MDSFINHGDLTKRFGHARLLDVEPWQMSMAERAYLVLLLSQMRPAKAVEVGSGGSTVVLAEFCKELTVVDPEPSPLLEPLRRGRLRNRRGVRVVEGPSQQHLAAELTPEVDLVLIDGDHAREMIRQDVQTVLDARPAKQRLVLLHDTANPECRAGMEAADWEACPWVHFVSLDQIEAPPSNPHWGGLGVAHLYAHPRTT